MQDKHERWIARYRRRQQICAYAPNACRAFRKHAKMTQNDLGWLLGVHGSTISALERGDIRNYRAAEAALILNGENLELLQISETEGLREKVKLAIDEGIPINHTYFDR